MSYKIRPLRGPRLAGRPLKVLASLAKNPVTLLPLRARLFRDMGIVELLETSVGREPHLVSPPLPGQGNLSAEEAEEGISWEEWQKQASPPEGFPFATAADYHQAYLEGRTTPQEVAEGLLDAVSQSEAQQPALRAFIAQDRADLLRQANLSTERYQKEESRGPLDGVPLAVKDEIDQRPYPTTVGTTFLGRSAVTEDATVVERLRQAGALLIGKTNMHEVGLGTSGINPHHGTARNPYAPGRITGGSSSGTAAAVAAGFCPVGVGADGGGSIRIPSALCGLVGLKPTFGRVSEEGAFPLCWSVAHIGPMAASVRDAALAYAVMAGPDPKDLQSQRQPPLRWSSMAPGDLQGMRLGIFRPWFQDASSDVLRICSRLTEQLQQAGATIHEIHLDELELIRAVQTVTIGVEMAAANLPYLEKHSEEYGADVALLLYLARSLSSVDYVHAQRIRARLCQHFAKALEQVDAIITPTTASTAALIHEDALSCGESNLELLDQMTRFVFAANVTGLPAISFPAGYDSLGLPVGFQALGRPWHEEQLLHLALVAEQLVPRQLPTIHFPLLSS